LESWRLNSFRC